MKKTFVVLCFSSILLTACQFNNDQKVNSGITDSLSTLYIEFIDSSENSASTENIQLIKERLFSHLYFLGDKTNNWQGIQEQKTDWWTKENKENVVMTDPCRFQELNSMSSENNPPVKITITWKKAINDSIINFSYLGSNRDADGNWHACFNPGNFRFNPKETGNEMSIEEWAVRTIVLCTYK